MMRDNHFCRVSRSILASLPIDVHRVSRALSSGVSSAVRKNIYILLNLRIIRSHNWIQRLSKETNVNYEGFQGFVNALDLFYVFSSKNFDMKEQT